MQSQVKIFNLSFKSNKKRRLGNAKRAGNPLASILPSYLVAVCLGKRWSHGRGRIRVEIGPETRPWHNQRVIWMAVWPAVLQPNWQHFLSWGRVRMKLTPRKLKEISLACFDYIHVNSHLQNLSDDDSHALTGDLQTRWIYRMWRPSGSCWKCNGLPGTWLWLSQGGFLFCFMSKLFHREIVLAKCCYRKV